MKQTQISYPLLQASPQSKTLPQLGLSFKTTVGQLPATEPQTHSLRDGEVVLFKRSQSRMWQYRFKLFEGTWFRASTHKANLVDATRVAVEQYDDARFRERLGLAPAKQRFTDIAAETVAELKADLTAGTGKKIYVDYVSIIERYFIPFFGERQLQNIKHADIAEFERWRNQRMGKQPKSSTLMNFASAFNRVCETAVARGWISERVPLPKMTRKGLKGSVRPAFTKEEVVQLRTFMLQWQHLGKSAAEREHRPLLCDYVNFLLYTGIRHGTESKAIRWTDCEWYETEGTRYLRVRVSGKTGQRYLIAKHAAVQMLQGLHQRQRDIKDKPFDSVLARSTKLVFRSEKGLNPRTFNGMFDRLLRDCGLRETASGERRTLYSLRHTYATEELVMGTDIHTLARQMGTSVRMLEQHYSKLTATMAAASLA